MILLEPFEEVLIAHRAPIGPVKKQRRGAVNKECGRRLERGREEFGTYLY
jgi:hypothetical protein